MSLKDQIIREFFWNFPVSGTQTSVRRDGKPVFSYEINGYKLTSLYERLLESQIITDGRPTEKYFISLVGT